MVMGWNPDLGTIYGYHPSLTLFEWDAKLVVPCTWCLCWGSFKTAHSGTEYRVVDLQPNQIIIRSAPGAAYIRWLSVRLISCILTIQNKDKIIPVLFATLAHLKMTDIFPIFRKLGTMLCLFALYHNPYGVSPQSHSSWTSITNNLFWWPETISLENDWIMTTQVWD